MLCLEYIRASTSFLTEVKGSLTIGGNYFCDPGVLKALFTLLFILKLKTI